LKSNLQQGPLHSVLNCILHGHFYQLLSPNKEEKALEQNPNRPQKMWKVIFAVIFITDVIFTYPTTHTVQINCAPYLLRNHT